MILAPMPVGVSEMASAKMASAIGVRIDDVGSILKFRIGFPFGENNFRIGSVSSSGGGWLPRPCLPTPFLIPRQGSKKSGPQRARRGISMPRGKNCRETIFAAQLPCNNPHRGGNFERGKNPLSCEREEIWAAFWEAIWVRVIASQKLPRDSGPEGPNLEKNQDLGTRLKFSSEIETNNIFKRDWKFQASHPPNPSFCGEFSRSRLKISSEIEVFKRDWKFQAKTWNFQAFKRDLFFSRFRPSGWGVNFSREASRCLARPSGSVNVAVRTACACKQRNNAPDGLHSWEQWQVPVARISCATRVSVALRIFSG